MDKPSDTGIKIVTSIRHKHATRTTKFLITHQSSKNIIISNLYFPLLFNSVIAPQMTGI